MTLAKTFTASAVTLLGLASRVAGVSVASTYLASYHTDEGFPVSDMQWSKYTDVKYAFAYVL
jgi:chitinase